MNERSGKDRHPSDQSARLEGLRERNLAWSQRRADARPDSGAWTRQSWTLPRAEARAMAREYYRKYPRAAYATEVESWRVLPGDIIEFTMRRLPTAD
ncbi:MAG: hypothetical protein BroJett030_22690 [Alphaproteobacteria bacterium]|nr:MAG: hypothetical protein BroJett030_22690 [Alphaproteobacteria bacterium]